MSDVAEVLKVSSGRLKYIKQSLRALEQELNVRLTFEGNQLHILGGANEVFFAKPVLQAIARGFSVKDALLLKKEDYLLNIIDLRDFCNTENCMERVRSRVIGTKGTIKTTIERATDSKIAVYGHTIAVISPFYSAQYALDAILKIVRGSKHSSVLNYLAGVRKDLFVSKLTGKL